MGRIIELIKSFINPVQPEKSIDELALEAGIGEADLNLLKSSMGGVTNFKFADVEEPKKGKNTKIASKRTPVQDKPRKIEKDKNLEYERD